MAGSRTVHQTWLPVSAAGGTRELLDVVRIGFCAGNRDTRQGAFGAGMCLDSTRGGPCLASRRAHGYLLLENHLTRGRGVQKLDPDARKRCQVGNELLLHGLASFDRSSSLSADLLSSHKPQAHGRPVADPVGERFGLNPWQRGFRPGCQILACYSNCCLILSSAGSQPGGEVTPFNELCILRREHAFLFHY